MKNTAKVFLNGRSQAVRLPKEYRFDADEVFITKDDETGYVILMEKPKSWDAVFDQMNQHKLAEKFVLERDQEPVVDKELF